MQILPCITALTVSGSSSSRVQARNLDLLCMRVFEAGDTIGDDRLIALKADLHMAKSGIRERREFLARQ